MDTSRIEFLMKALLAALVIALATAPMSVRADDARKAMLRAMDSQSMPSLIFTPQAVQRQAPGPNSNDALPVEFRQERPAPSRSQSLVFLWATTFACAAMGSHCASEVPTASGITPPGSEPWRIAGCKSPEACPPFWEPESAGPFVRSLPW